MTSTSWAQVKTVQAILTTEGLIFDPVKAKGYQQFQVINLLVDPLVRKDPSQGLVSGVAKRWESSDEGATYTFFLDDRSQFSNGDQVEAADVAFSFHRHMEGGSGSILASYLNQVINKIEEKNKTVVFHLKGPYPPFLELISMAGLGVLSRKSTSDKIIGSGPFVVGSDENGKTCLVRRKEYHFRRPDADKYCFRIERDVDKTIQLLKTGEVNLAMGSPLEVALQTESEQGFVSSPTFSLVATHFYFNHSRPFFQKMSNRQKVRNILLNVREKEGVLTRFDTKLDHFIPNGIMPGEYHVPVQMDEKSLPDLKGTKLKIVFPYGILTQRAVQTIVDTFQKSGAEVEFLNVKGKELLAPIVAGDFDIIMVPYQGVISDPDGYLDMIQPSSMMAKAHTPVHDLLVKLDSARFVADRGLRLAKYSSALRTWESEIPMVPFSQNAIPIVHQKRLKLPNLNNSYHLNLREVTFEK